MSDDPAPVASLLQVLRALKLGDPLVSNILLERLAHRIVRHCFVEIPVAPGSSAQLVQVPHLYLPPPELMEWTLYFFHEQHLYPNDYRRWRTEPISLRDLSAEVRPNKSPFASTVTQAGKSRAKAFIDSGDFPSAIRELNSVISAKSPVTFYIDTGHSDAILADDDNKSPDNGPRLPSMPHDILTISAMLAESILEKTDGFGWPVNVAAIARAFGAKLYETDASTTDGAQSFVTERDNEIRIVVSSKLTRPWKRIHVAKELFYVLRDTQSNNLHQLFENSALPTKSDSDEDFSDHFARALLMPEKLVTELWPQIKNRAALAAGFDVPVAEFNKRITELNFEQEIDDDELEGRSAPRRSNAERTTPSETLSS